MFLVATTSLTIHATTQKYANIVEYKKLAPKYADDFAKGLKPIIQHHATAALTFLHVNNAALAKAIANDVKKANKMVNDGSATADQFNLLINAIFFDNQMPKALSSQHPNDARKLVKYIDKAKASGTTKGGSTQTEADAKAALQNLADKLESTIGYTHKALEHTINFLSSFATNGADVKGQVPSSDPNQPWTITPQAKIDAMKNVANSANLGTLKNDAHTLSTTLQTTAAKLDGNANETTIKAIIANATTGQLHQDVLAFIAAFNKAATGSKKVAKTPTELQKHYKNLLEAAVPAVYNFSTSTNLGGNRLNVPANDQSWFVVKDTSTTKLSGTVGAALISVQDAQAAYKEALDLINAINKVDAAGVMQKADNSVITDTDITDEIARAKKAVADAQTAVDGAFEAKGAENKDDTPADIIPTKDTHGNLVSVSLNPANFSDASKKSKALTWLNAKFTEADGKVTNFENLGTFSGVDYEREVALKDSLAAAIALLS